MSIISWCFPIIIWLTHKNPSISTKGIRTCCVWYMMNLFYVLLLVQLCLHKPAIHTLTYISSCFPIWISNCFCMPENQKAQQSIRQFTPVTDLYLISGLEVYEVACTYERDRFFSLYLIMAFALAAKCSSPLRPQELTLPGIVQNTDEEVDEDEDPLMWIDASALDSSMVEEA